MISLRLASALGCCLAIAGPITATAQAGRWATVNGARLYYERSGRGPTVILIHGFSLDHRMWAPQVQALRRHFTVLRYDVRGFGRSGPLTPQHDAVADLVGLMDQLNIRQAHIVGMSMGGAIATDFALVHPERLFSLTLIGANVNGFAHADWGSRFAPIFEAGGKGDLGAAKALWLRDRFVTPVYDSSSVAKLIRSIVMDCPCQQLGDPVLMPGEVKPAAFERLEALHVATLVVNGQADDPDMLTIGDAVARRVPGARRVVIPNAGHLVNLEQPVVLNDALLTFLKAQR